MEQLTFRKFDGVYQEVLEKIYAYWTPQMQQEIALHNYGWRPGLFDFKEYLRTSSIRFYHAYRSFDKNNEVRTVCDVGGFWGVFPLTLKRLGYDVTMTESLNYYSNSFNDLFSFIKSEDVRIIDWDPFEPKAKKLNLFDAVTVMAVLEHYPHSLKSFMKNITSLINADGSLYIDVPNIAYWPRRIKLLYGRTPLTPLEVIYNSEMPFIGHHHEFTMAELLSLASLSGLDVRAKSFFNCPKKITSIKTRLWTAMDAIVYAILPDACECLALSCKKKDNHPST